MVKVDIEKLEKDEGTVVEQIPTLNIEAEKGLYVYGTVERIWAYTDKRFPTKDGSPNRVGMTINVEDGRGYVWNGEKNELISDVHGKYNLFFRHTYLLKAFMNEDGNIKDISGQPIIIFNRGKGDLGYLYRVAIGQEQVKKFLV